MVTCFLPDPVDNHGISAQNKFTTPDIISNNLGLDPLAWIHTEIHQEVNSDLDLDLQSEVLMSAQTQHCAAQALQQPWRP